MNKNNQDIIIYNTDDGKAQVTLFAQEGDVWMNQNQLSELFDTSKQNIGQHTSNILQDNELNKNSVVKNFFTTATDGKDYNVTFYNLDMILAIGFRVRSKRGVQFRKWANSNLKEYIIKGFVIDDQRLKNPDGRPDYFDELLERIRDIRASEKRFYQKVRDLFALSTDYDKSDKATQMFFAETQNKLLYAITKQTAAEIIIKRADSEKQNMGLTAWQGTIVRKQDITIAKNYLNHYEIDSLNRLTTIFLETAELRAKNRQEIKIDFWKQNVDSIIVNNDFPLLGGNGSISKKQMQETVKDIYSSFNQKRKTLEAQQADQEDMEDLKAIEDKIKVRK